MKIRNLTLLPIVILLFAGMFVLPVEAQNPTKKDRNAAKRLVEAGNKAYERKNYRLAADSYTKAAALVPNDPETLYKKGIAHRYLKENSSALTELNLALNKGYKPQLEIYKVRWQLNKDNKNLDLAAEDIQRILKAEPNNIEFTMELAEISMAKGAFKEAADAYEKALARSPNNANLYYHVALARSKMGDVNGQASAAEQAVRRNTLFLAESYVLIGDARMFQKRYPEAMTAYELALKSKPDTDPEAYIKLGELFRRENRIDEAIEISKAGLRQFVNNGKIYTAITWYYSLADRKKDAIDAGRSATRILPNEPLGYTNLCRAYNQNDQPQMAISECNNALRLKPNDGETNFYLGRAYALLKRTAEADKYYKSALTGLIEYTQNHPDDSDGFYLLGNAYAEDDQGTKAIESYKKCLELNPRFVNAMYNIGVIHIKLKNKAGAMDQYENLLNVDKKSADDLKSSIDKMP
ncbi:MAG: tetratricopeptide repeat protein [Pyrinomonadaceae bacterium]